MSYRIDCEAPKCLACMYWIYTVHDRQTRPCLGLMARYIICVVNGIIGRTVMIDNLSQSVD